MKFYGAPKKRKKGLLVGKKVVRTGNSNGRVVINVIFSLSKPHIMVNKGVVLHWLTDKEIPFRKGKKKSADLLAESIAILNGLYFLGVISALYYIEEVDYTIVLHALSVLVLSAFIAVFLSIWPKTRSRKGMGKNNYEDPSFLVLSIVFTFWNTMLMLKIGEKMKILPINNSLPWQDYVINVLDILNSSFFLLAALQFDFNPVSVQNVDRYKEVLIHVRKWLNTNSRITKITAICLLSYAFLIILPRLAPSLIISKEKLSMIPVVLFSLFTVVVLGTFLLQLYKERKFGKWLRRAVLGLMIIAAVLNLLDFFDKNLFPIALLFVFLFLGAFWVQFYQKREFDHQKKGLVNWLIRSVLTILVFIGILYSEIDTIPEEVEAIAKSFYHFGLGVVFLLLAFSQKEKVERGLRDTILKVEIQRTHFIGKQITVILCEIREIQKELKAPQTKLKKLDSVLESVIDLNKLIFSYNVDNIERGTLRENFKSLVGRLTTIFYYWDGIKQKAVSRINAEGVNYDYLGDRKFINFTPQQQLDILRLITELCLNGNSAYSSEEGNWSGVKPGEIKIEAKAGGLNQDALIIRISNEAKTSKDDRDKIDEALDINVTPELLRSKSEQVYDNEQTDGDQQSLKTVSTSKGLIVVKAICQVNEWNILRIKTEELEIAKEGVTIQVFIPLN